MTILGAYVLFLLKCLTFAVTLLIVLAGIFALRKKKDAHIQITPLHEEYTQLKKTLHHAIKRKKIKENKRDKKAQRAKPILYVLDFQGDISASQVSALREEITALLSVAEQGDEVLLRLESPGGTVNGYGLAAAQLERIRKHELSLTICIDKVAASGGYLMSSVGNHIIAAPFAIIGSIGVVAQLPNFHRFLKARKVDIELITAGEYKRTLTIFGENTEKGREKFKEDLEKIHDVFKQHVTEYRHQTDIEKVATGEHWLGEEAFQLKLIDALGTSDEFLIQKMLTHQVFHLKKPMKPSLKNKLLQAVKANVSTRLQNAMFWV